MVVSTMDVSAETSHLGAMPAWRYAPTDLAGTIEFGFWSGPGSRLLRSHFHDETQITMVLAGRRAFRIGDRVVMVEFGHGIMVPAGRLHAPVALTDCYTACINLYVKDECEGDPFRIFKITHPALSACALPPGAISCLARDILPVGPRRMTLESDPGGLRAALAGSGRRIAELAADFQLSREGFSRRVRRELNVAPHGFRILSRLNHARRLLRAGQPIAAVAAEAGFSDQSHLTRLFRETFGTTPGLYQRG